MHYSAVKKLDIANGPGVRVSLFVSGCRNRCPGCFQPETWDFDHGEPFTEETQAEILCALAPDHVSGLTVLGGEPFEPENQQGLLPFLMAVREKYPDKDIWCFTGFTLEGILSGTRASTETAREMLSLIDVLVDGPFIKEKKNLALSFRGSENQRLIDMKKTLQTGTVTPWRSDSV